MSEESLIYFGSAVKAVGDGKVEGYLLRFGSAADTDVEGEFFTADTDFDVEFPAKSTIYYHHGLDSKLGKRKIGRGEMKADEVGIWFAGQLNLRDSYEKMIYKMVEDGKLGWSSGSAPHLVDTEKVGKSVRIKSWPLGLDASLTPIPAEMRNGAVALKSISPPITLEDSEDESVSGILDTFIDGEGNLRAGVPFAKRFDAVRTAVEKLADEAQGVSNALQQVFNARKTALEKRGEEIASGVKSGQVISKANHDQMMAAQDKIDAAKGAMGDVHTTLGELRKMYKSPKSEETKSVDQDSIRRLHARFLHQEMAATI